MHKIGVKLGAKLDTTIGAKSGAKPGATQGAKPDIIYTKNSARFRKRMQKMSKIVPTHKIAPFYPKNGENTLKDGLDAEKEAKRDVNHRVLL